jgi:hypothetical protein
VSGCSSRRRSSAGVEGDAASFEDVVHRRRDDDLGETATAFAATDIDADLLAAVVFVPDGSDGCRFVLRVHEGERCASALEALALVWLAERIVELVCGPVAVHPGAVHLHETEPGGDHRHGRNGVERETQRQTVGTRRRKPGVARTLCQLREEERLKRAEVAISRGAVASPAEE